MCSSVQYTKKNLCKNSVPASPSSVPFEHGHPSMDSGWVEQQQHGEGSLYEARQLLKSLRQSGITRHLNRNRHLSAADIVRILMPLLSMIPLDAGYGEDDEAAVAVDHVGDLDDGVGVGVGIGAEKGGAYRHHEQPVPSQMINGWFLFINLPRDDATLDLLLPTFFFPGWEEQATPCLTAATAGRRLPCPPRLPRPPPSTTSTCQLTGGPAERRRRRGTTGTPPGDTRTRRGRWVSLEKSCGVTVASFYIDTPKNCR